MAFISVVALVLALASSLAWSSHPFESARDQYEAREDRLEPQLLSEATDHRPEVRHPDFITKPTNSSKQVAAPDLQVGCGDGFIQEKLQDNSETDKNKIQLPKKRKPSGVRRKRSYSQWPYQVTYTHPYQSISVWQPPVYQLSRPYFIPIYGVQGRVPIYYPPQPIYTNPGVPKDNRPQKPFQGPTYLPPVDSTTSPTTMTIIDRFNGGDNVDDRPVWDLTDGNQQTTQRPSGGGSSVVPTRRPRPGGARPPPPLVHNPTDPKDFQTGGSSNNNERVPTTARPAARPPQPPAQPPPQTRPNEPSRCVWAIISCCSSTNSISYECFEQRGCPGAFWDTNPCDSEFAQAAIAAALNYYNK